MVGTAAEAAATLREGMRTVYAGLQVTVPVLTVVVRKCYGMAGMGTTDKNGLDLKLAWPSAEWGSLPIEGGVAAAFRREIEAAADPRQRQTEIEAELRRYASPLLTAEAFAVEDVIDPRDSALVLRTQRGRKPAASGFEKTAQIQAGVARVDHVLHGEGFRGEER